MLPSQVPSARTIARSLLKYAAASFAERMSGRETISISATPARLRSTNVSVGERSWIDLPASCSRCSRSMRIVIGVLAVGLDLDLAFADDRDAGTG